jgi:hypothetical protein
LYAQHWAEMNGEPEAPVREQLVERYGEQVVRPYASSNLTNVLQCDRDGFAHRPSDHTGGQDYDNRF